MSRSAVLSSIRHLRRVLAVQCGHEQSDEQLLRSFIEHHDDSAFSVLVRRHGPMVLGVCRRVLGHEQDAEDAFQATFLVLARRAASLRDKSALSGFLHATALHLASKAKRAAGRRRKYEGQAQRHSFVHPSEQLLWREVRTLLDEEIAHLPEIYRGAFILCCIENLSRAEAAHRLGVKEGTLSSRLAEARRRLQRRLARRGVELTAIAAAVALEAQPASALPIVSLPHLTGAAVSPAVDALAKSTSSLSNIGKAKLSAVLLLAVVTSGALVSMHQPASEPPAAAAEQKPKTTLLPHGKPKTIEIRGRVLAPDGKPAIGARVYVNSRYVDEGALATATTDRGGRFAIALRQSDLVYPRNKLPMQRIRLVAMAKGCGPDWLDVPLSDTGKDATLRLVKDDVPIRGRILSLEGKPLPGVKVSVAAVEAFPKSDLTRVLQGVRNGVQLYDITDMRLFSFLGGESTTSAQTDADGRFRLHGIGRERIVRLNIEGPGIHYTTIRVMTRAGQSVRNPSNRWDTIHAATFEYLARPARLIRGTVREKGSGKPLAGIGIGSGDTTARTSTDAQGRYELPGCPKGDRYSVMAFPGWDQPYFNAAASVKDTEGLGPITIDLEMVRGIRFEGKAIDAASGKPVQGHVQYYPLSPNPNVKDHIGLGAAGAATYSWDGIAADGSFRCIVLPGPGFIGIGVQDKRYMTACVDPRTIEAEGGDNDTLLIPFHDGFVTGIPQQQFKAILLINPTKDSKTISKTIRLTRAAEVKGTLLDPEGKPLTGARLRGSDTSYHWGSLDTEQFTIFGVNPLRPRQVYFVHEARRLIGSLTVKGTETKPLTVRLQPWAGVRGRLVDADGQPMRNVSLRGSEFLAAIHVRTDAEGRFRLEGFIPGRRYNVYYDKDKPSVSGTVLEGFIGKPGEMRDVGDVRGVPFRQE